MAPSAKTENKLDAPGFDVKVPRDDKDAAAKDFKALDFWGQFDAAAPPCAHTHTSELRSRPACELREPQTRT